MNINLQKIKIDFSCFDNIIVTNEHDTKSEFFDIPGKQHYQLLAYLSTLVNDCIIIDIGTHRGSSALALSYNPTNKIMSYDIINNVTNQNIINRRNIIFNIDNIFDNLESSSLLSAPIIFLDI